MEKKTYFQQQKISPDLSNSVGNTNQMKQFNGDVDNLKMYHGV